MLTDDVKLRKIGDLFCVGIDTPLGFVATYATEDWLEFVEHVNGSMGLILAYMKRTMGELRALAEERGGSAPDAVSKEFPERV